MSPGRLRWRLALALQVGLTAQAQTYVIDAAGGAGSHFTNLGSAIAAVPDGATLLVRAGTYAPFVLDGRSLSILGDPGVVISGPVSIANTLAHQPVVLAGLTFTTSTQGAFAHVLVDDCAGRLVFERITTPVHMVPVPIVVFFFQPLSLRVVRCAQVFVRHSTMSHMAASDSNTVIESCLLIGCDAGFSGGYPIGATTGLIIAGGSAAIVGTTVIRGGGNGTPAAGMEATLADLRIAEGSIETALVPGYATTRAIAIASSQVRIDPRVAFVVAGSTPILGSATFGPVPAVRNSPTSPGGALRGEVVTAVGDLVWLGVSLPVAAPWQVPGLLAPVWLDPATFVLQAVGQQQATAPVAGTIAVPNLGALRGTSLVWQAVVWNGAGGFVVTNPSIALID